MNIAFAAKLICDLMLWYGTAGFVLSFYGASLSFLPPLIIVLISCLSALLYEKKPVYRYSLLPFLLFSLCVERSFAGLMLTIPPLFYGAWLCHDSRFFPEYEKSVGYFKASALSMLGFYFLALLLSTAMSGKILRYLLIFLFSGIFMLRILRHDEQNRRDLRLQLINMVLLVLLSAAALFLSSDLFLSSALKTLSLLYQKLIEPLLFLFAYISVMLFMLLIKLLSLLKIGKPGQVPDIQIPKIGEMLNPENNINNGVKLELLKHVFEGLGIATFFILAFIIFRRIAARKSEQKGGFMASQGFFWKPDAPPSILSALTPRTYREKIRLIYRRFLKDAEKKGIRFGPGDTSARIERLCLGSYDPSLLSEMRDIYITARYSPSSITRDEAARMKEVYSKLIKEKKR